MVLLLLPGNSRHHWNGRKCPNKNNPRDGYAHTNKNYNNTNNQNIRNRGRDNFRGNPRGNFRSNFRGKNKFRGGRVTKRTPGNSQAQQGGVAG